MMLIAIMNDAHHRDCDQKDIEEAMYLSEALLCCCSERERVVVALSARCFKQQKIPQTVHFQRLLSSQSLHLQCDEAIMPDNFITSTMSSV